MENPNLSCREGGPGDSRLHGAGADREPAVGAAGLGDGGLRDLARRTGPRPALILLLISRQAAGVAGPAVYQNVCIRWRKRSGVWVQEGSHARFHHVRLGPKVEPVHSSDSAIVSDSDR